MTVIVILFIKKGGNMKVLVTKFNTRFDRNYENVPQFDTSQIKDDYIDDVLLDGTPLNTVLSSIPDINPISMVDNTMVVKIDVSTQPYITNRNQLFDKNYIITKDTLFSVKYWFITSVELKTREMVSITCELDVFMTYYFNITRFKKFNVDRGHLDRYLSNNKFNFGSGSPLLIEEDINKTFTANILESETLLKPKYTIINNTGTFKAALTDEEVSQFTEDLLLNDLYIVYYLISGVWDDLPNGRYNLSVYSKGQNRKYMCPYGVGIFSLRNPYNLPNGNNIHLALKTSSGNNIMSISDTRLKSLYNQSEVIAIHKLPFLDMGNIINIEFNEENLPVSNSYQVTLNCGSLADQNFLTFEGDKMISMVSVGIQHNDHFELPIVTNEFPIKVNGIILDDNMYKYEPKCFHFNTFRYRLKGVNNEFNINIPYLLNDELLNILMNYSYTPDDNSRHVLIDSGYYDDENINTNGFLSSTNDYLPNISDKYKDYIAENKARNKQIVGNALIGVGTGAVSGAVAGSVLPGLGTVVGAVGGAVLGGISQVASEQFNENINRENLKGAPKDISNIPAGTVFSLNKLNRIYLQKIRTELQSLNQVAEVFYKYGYSLGKFYTFDELLTRENFNYIKSPDAYTIIENVSNFTRDLFKLAFNNGVRFWNVNSSLFNNEGINYRYHNVERKYL